MISIEYMMMSIFWAHSPISSWHKSFWWPFRNYQYIACYSNLDVQLKRVTTKHLLHSLDGKLNNVTRSNDLNAFNISYYTVYGIWCHMHNSVTYHILRCMLGCWCSTTSSSISPHDTWRSCELTNILAWLCSLVFMSCMPMLHNSLQVD